MSRRPLTESGEPGIGHLLLVLAGSAACVLTLAGLPRFPMGSLEMPSDIQAQLQLLVRAPTPVQQDAVIALLGWVFWAVWTFVLVTTVLRIALFSWSAWVAMRRGSAWCGGSPTRSHC
jgi:hypothetical protein